MKWSNQNTCATANLLVRTWNDRGKKTTTNSKYWSCNLWTDHIIIRNVFTRILFALRCSSWTYISCGSCSTHLVRYFGRKKFDPYLFDSPVALLTKRYKLPSLSAYCQSKTSAIQPITAFMVYPSIRFTLLLCYPLSLILFFHSAFDLLMCFYFPSFDRWLYNI